MRESGFYWVKFYGKRTIAQYNSHSNFPWQMIGTELTYNDDDFEKIGGKINLPKDVEEDQLSCYDVNDIDNWRPSSTKDEIG